MIMYCVLQCQAMQIRNMELARLRFAPQLRDIVQECYEERIKELKAASGDDGRSVIVLPETGPASNAQQHAQLISKLISLNNDDDLEGHRVWTLVFLHLEMEHKEGLNNFPSSAANNFKERQRWAKHQGCIARSLLQKFHWLQLRMPRSVRPKIQYLLEQMRARPY